MCWIKLEISQQALQWEQQERSTFLLEWIRNILIYRVWFLFPRTWIYLDSLLCSFYVFLVCLIHKFCVRFGWKVFSEFFRKFSLEWVMKGAYNFRPCFLLRILNREIVLVDFQWTLLPSVQKEKNIFLAFFRERIYVISEWPYCM